MDAPWSEDELNGLSHPEWMDFEGLSKTVIRRLTADLTHQSFDVVFSRSDLDLSQFLARKQC